MTVSAQNAFDGPYIPNGVTTDFPFTFEVITAAELKVCIDGVEQDPGLYTVELNENNEGGTVSFAVAPTGSELIVSSDPEFKQETAFENAGAFLSRSIEQALDRLSVMANWLRHGVSRSLRLPVGEEMDELPAAAARAETLLGFNLLGVRTLYPLDGLSAAPPNFTFDVDTLPPGAEATVTPSGAYPDILLTFGIPEGQPGATTGASWGAIGGTLSNQTDLQNALDAKQSLDADLTAIAALSTTAFGRSLLTKADAAAVKTALSLTKTDVGLNNVDNTADEDKPVSTAQQAALDLKKNIAPNIQTVASSATVTPTFSDDQVNITAQAAALALANPTGTAVDGWGIVIRIKDNGTARAISYGSQYRAIGVTLPTTTVLGKTLYIGMVFNEADTKWDVVAVRQQA